MSEKFSYQISGIPLAELFSSYESGTFLEFKNTRFHSRDNIGGLAAGTVKYFAEAVGQNGITIGETNMMLGGQLEKGHWFSVNKIGVKVTQRAPAGSPVIDDKQWYENVLATLFKYGLIRFRINGLDHLGEFRLSQLLPAIQSVGQVGAIVENGGANVAVSSNTAPLMAAGVFDLHDRQIKLSEMVNFWCELVWDIPARIWNPATRTYIVLGEGAALSGDGETAWGAALEQQLMVIPDNTVVELQLIGEELRAQG